MELVNGLYNKDMTMFVDPYQNGVQRFDKLYKYMQMAVKGLGDNTSSAMEVAQALYVIKNLELYRDYPVPGTNGIELYKDFDSFCKDCFKAKKSTIYNYIALYKRFGADSGNKSEQFSPYIKDFTYTQLLLMLPLSDAELSLIKPDWTCSQIKKHVKAVKTKSDENSNRLEKVKEEDIVVEEEVRYQSYKLDTPEHCEEFLRTYQRWDKIADFSIGVVAVEFHQIKLRNFTVVAYASTYAGEWDVLYYVYNHTLNYFEGVKDHFSVVNKMNAFGAAALLSTLPVEFADIETSVYPGKSRENK